MPLVRLDRPLVLPAMATRQLMSSATRMRPVQLGRSLQEFDSFLNAGVQSPVVAQP